MRKVFSRILAAASAVAGYTMMATPAFAQSYYDYSYTGADAAASAGFLGFSFIYLLCICCVPFIISSVIAYLVYKDAQKHNIDNAAVWAILCFFFNIIGVLIYFLVPRAEATKGKTSTPVKSE